ncbi:serine/threonine-protein kinase [Nonomuraea fuscirosea]|uniref:serine/threonine-protein kinase n=1 Tax=Nonomuraea fuscirosea TaxID=1291556 RepID=UPI00342F583D
MIADRYRLDERIGSGPMGEVWRGYDTRADWVVAVKVLGAKAAGAGTREVLRQHAQAVARVIHPNVAMVLDVGEHEGAPFLVMEYLTGNSLREERAARGQLRIMEVCDLVGQAAAGLDAAHRAGVVHGQVDPDSFRLAGSGVLKVVGFGMDDREPVRGDERYAAPERAAGQPAQAPGDVYALGCVCYELLCGRVPVETAGENGGRPVPPSAIRNEVSPELDRLLLAMLAEDPAQRPTSGENIRRTLAAIARPKPAPQAPPAAPGGAGAMGAAPGQTGAMGAVPGVAGAMGAGAVAGSGQGAGSGATEVFQHLGGAPPRAGDTAIYQAGDLEPAPPSGPNRKLMIQLGVAVLVIAAVTVGMVMWAGARREPPVAVLSPTPTPTLTTEEPPPTTPFPTPTDDDDGSGLVRTLDPDDEPTSLIETAAPKATLGDVAPAGGYGKWLQRFDEAITAQEKVNGINPAVAGKAHEKLRKAARKAREGHVDSALDHVAGVYRDLVRAQEKGDMNGSGPAARFLLDWRIPDRYGRGA